METTMKLSLSPSRLLAILFMSGGMLLVGCNAESGGDPTENASDATPGNNDGNGGSGDDETTDPGDGGTTDPEDDDTADSETYSISGEVIGLTNGSAQLQLRIPGQMNLNYIVNESGTFTFSSPQTSYSDPTEGDSYTIELLSTPDGFQCSLINASGTVASTDITDVELFCIPEINARAVNRSEFVELT